THYMRDVGDQPLEFESRRKQTQRAEITLQQISALNPAFVIHLGDLVQEYPETPNFTPAIQEAQAQLKRCGVFPHHVAGNHDVGDKTDATMPTHPTNAQSLAFYHEQFGPSWYSFDHQDCHFIVLNSQIFNANLSETQTQWEWFEQDLHAHKNKRKYLFFHLPLYLNNINEPGLGHYDNINPPDRDRLYTHIVENNMELVFSGHVHYPFYDHIGTSRYLIAPSPTFTRPGFGHLFASAPPPERGRDDTNKLGFYLMRVFKDRTDAHFIRTHGAETQSPHNRFISCTSASLPTSPIGLTLNHPITPTGEVPLAYPSAVRTPVRNDLLFLSAIELGATSVRFPWRDLLNPFLRTRLQMLKSEGITLTATFLEPRINALPEFIQTHTDMVQTWEVQLPGVSIPSPDMFHTLKLCMEQAEISLCPIISNERVPGKQHLRTRMGYTTDELTSLNSALQAQNVHLHRVLCRIPPNESPCDSLPALQKHSHISHIDLSVELTTQDDVANAIRIAEACFAIAQMPKSKLFIAPLNDLDRTMDAIYGLLDPLCNPRPAFHTLRCLNTLLFSPQHHQDYYRTDVSLNSLNHAYQLESSTRKLTLIIPTNDTLSIPQNMVNKNTQVYNLINGEQKPPSLSLTTPYPILIVN
ncbi:MAG: metallophosphoesterase family protein, partial [Candidatus Latescibacterota bacterium]